MKKEMYRYICENCGRIGIYENPKQAFKEGWDYPPSMYHYKMISPRTCPNCGIETTLFWAISTAEVKKFEDMSVKQKLVFFLITGEPNTIIIHDEKGDKDV